MSDTFYADLESFSDFGGFADFTSYTPLPDDWVILAGDIRGSTAAIADGRYKEVNMLGASVITAVLNACPGLDLPFVFGGDGGAVAVPSSHAVNAARALSALMHHADRVYGLSLRAAAVPVTRLRAEGFDVTVRRHRLNGSNHLAMFGGGGIDQVDRILKGSADDRDALHPVDDAPDLEGLSCRWEPLRAQYGRMIALMVLPTGPEPAEAVYREILRALRDILQEPIRSHAPARDATMRFGWPPRGLAVEVRAHAIRQGRALGLWVHGLFTSAVQKWCHFRGIEIGGYDGKRYLEELKAQTDFRKFDGCLRIVLDCSADQVHRIEDWMARQCEAGRLVYGLHADTQALMTCLVFSLERGEHVHFVDAAGGGFARASEGFKARLARLRAGGAAG